MSAVEVRRASTRWGEIVAGRTAKLAASRRRRSVGLVFAVLSALVAVQVSGASPAVAAAAPVVTVHPQSVVGAGNATLTTAATGDPSPTVRWEVSNDGGATWDPQANATAPSLTVAPPAHPNVRQYRAVWTNAHGSATSDVATVRRAAPPVVTQQPQSGTWQAGQTMTFAAAATGEGPVTVQWQRRSPGSSSWNDLSGATSPALTLTAHPTLHLVSYRARFTSAGETTTSAEVTATVITTLLIDTQPRSVYRIEGATVTLTATAYGDEVPTVQWEVSTDGGATWADDPGSTPGSVSASGLARLATRTFSMTVAQDGWQYRARFSNSSGELLSDAATVRLGHIPQITAQPQASIVVTPGQSAEITVGYVSPSAVTIQWQRALKPSSGFVNIAGATSASYTIAPNGTSDLDRTRYRAVLTGTGGTTTSAVTTLTVFEAPAIVDQPDAQTYGVGRTVSLSSYVTGGPKPTATWEVSTDAGATWSFVRQDDNLVEASGGAPYRSTLSFTLADSDPRDRLFRVTFTNAAGQATSNPAPVTVRKPPTILAPPSSQTASPGDTVEFTVVGEGATSIQWSRVACGGCPRETIPGATSPTLTVVATSDDNDSSYRATLTNGDGSVSSSSAWLTVAGSAPKVYASPEGTLTDGELPQNGVSLCSAYHFEGCPIGFRADFAATAGASATSVRWETSIDGGTTWSTVPGETSLNDRTSTFTIAATVPADHERLVRAVFSNEWGSTASAAATMRVRSTPRVQQQPASTSAHVGEAATFTAGYLGYPAPTITWQVLRPGNTVWEDLVGAVGPTLTVADVGPTDSGNRYRALASNVMTEPFGALAPTDGSATLTVAPSGVAPTVATPEPLPLVAEGAPVRMAFSATGSPAPVPVFQVSSDGFETIMEVPDATVVVEGDTTTVSVEIEAPMMANEWQARGVFTNASGTATSDPLTLRVGRAPTAATPQPLPLVAEGTPVRMEFSATGSPAPAVVFQVSSDGFETVMEVPDATVVVEGDTTTVIVEIEAPLMANGWQARAVFTNELGTVITEPLTLLVHTP
jgi:hypothetical protein